MAVSEMSALVIGDDCISDAWIGDDCISDAWIGDDYISDGLVAATPTPVVTV
jgi:hypothetical protein